MPPDFLSQVHELERRYQELEIDHKQGIWNVRHLRDFDLQAFRGDNVYVWQTRHYGEINYFVSYLWVLKQDAMQLSNVFKETGSYGVESYEFKGRAISRDLIDSILEINYLENLLNLSGISDLHILDIGAGYGRLAFRLMEAYPQCIVSCIDAVPLSTCISRIYLKKYIESQRIIVHELDTVENLEKGKYKLAVNIHSFSEMPLSSVASWIDFLVAKEIEFLFLVPNGPELTLNDGTDFSLLLRRAGYEIIDCRLKYSDADFAKFSIYPSTFFLLQRR